MKELKQWRNATEDLTKVFLKRYFPHERYNKDTFWVGDRVGDALCVGDYFFCIDRMIEAIEYKASVDQLFSYYDMEVDNGLNDIPMRINFKNYIKYKDIEKSENKSK